MKIIRSIILLFLLSILGFTLPAQQGSQKIISNQDLTIIIDSISKVVKDKYIDLETGRKVGDYIQKRHAQKTYQELSYKDLGRKLTKDLRQASNDIHMSAFFWEPKETPIESILERQNNDYGAVQNYGFVETKIMEGNIGYLKIAHFTQWQFFEQAKQAANYSMQMLQNTDALLIDLRNNPGGFEDIVAYVMSYFLDGPARELQSYFCRYLNRRTSISVTEQLPLKKRPELPIYILVNKGTGSAAESFAYMMKHLNRATVLGETTAGAGNGASIFRVSDQFAIQVATVETINAVTQQSWEKVGVIPNIKLNSDLIDAKAYALAKDAGKKYRVKRMKRYEFLLNDLDIALQNYTPESADTKLIQALTVCKEVGLYNESTINNLGYNYLRQKGKPATAEIIFKANTLLFPNAANTYDSYAEALSFNKKFKLAIKNHQKSVELGRLNNDPSLSIFIENLQKALKMDK